MSWFERIVPSRIKTERRTRSVPEGLWTKCPACDAVLYRAEIERNLHVCPKCSHHMRINGREQSEATLNAALAGTFGVRTALVTGDQATIDEAAAELPGIEGVVVKQALGRQAARSLHPVEACRRIEEGAYRGYSSRAERPLYRPKGPFTLEIEWMHAGMADLCVQIPDVQRAGGRTVRYRAADYQTCYQMLLALLVMATPAAYQYPRP